MTSTAQLADALTAHIDRLTRDIGSFSTNAAATDVEGDSSLTDFVRHRLSPKGVSAVVGATRLH